MNNIDIDNIGGIINYCSKSNNFQEEYSIVKKIGIYCYDPGSPSSHYGAILNFYDSELSVDVPVSMRSFLNIKKYIDSHTKFVPTSQGLFNILSNFYGVNILLSYVSMEKNNFFETFLLMEQSNKFFCTNSYFSDVICMKNSIKIPIYVNKEIIEKNGMTDKEISIFHYLYWEGD